MALTWQADEIEFHVQPFQSKEVINSCSFGAAWRMGAGAYGPRRGIASFDFHLLDLEKAFWIVRWIGPNMLDPALPVIAQEVEAQAIGRRINFLDQLIAKSDELRGVQ